MTRTLQPASDGFALRTENPADRIALRGVSLRARLAGMSQRVTIDQTFVNLEPRAIEAVYTFPLPENAAVCGFEVLTADRVLTGAIEEAEEATEKYEEAIAGGHGAFVMEQDRPDVFTVRVGNLKPRQAAMIRLTYVCPLERADRQIRVAFPTTIAPRYATATATDPLDAAMDGDALNPPHVLRVPYGLSLDVEIDLGRELLECTSPSHRIQPTANEASHPVVRFAGGLEAMNRDVVLLLKMRKDEQPQITAAAGPDGASYLAVTFVPEFAENDGMDEASPTQTVFVLDCSGSMMGESIAQAKAALELCLRSLNAGDTFNICRFGSQFELMASEPLPYTEQTLRQALQYVRESGDLGGTELHAPLEAILRTPARAGTLRQIILLTDGQVTNEPAIVELCRKHRATNRIFSFGIGAASSTFLVKGVARATGGAAEFITAGERIDDKVLRTFARLCTPLISDIQIDWDGAEAQTLAEIPPIFDGDLLTLFARCPGRLPRQVTLSCRVGDRPLSWSVPVPADAAAAASSPSAVVPGEGASLISTMWARRTIQSLEEVNGPAVRARKRRCTREQEQLIQISKQFSILCSLTTFIAIEHRTEAERNEGQPALRRVPGQIAKDWGGVTMDCLVAGGSAAYACATPPPMGMPAPTASAGFIPKRSGRGLLGRLFGSGGSTNRSDAAAIAKKLADAESTIAKGPASPHPAQSSLPRAPQAEDRMIDLSALDAAGSGLLGLTRESDSDEDSAPGKESIATLSDLLNLQQFSGAFVGQRSMLTAMLATVGGTDWPGIVRQAMPKAILPALKSDVVQTVLVLLLLRTKFADQATLWQRAAGKAIKSFLAGALQMKPAEVENWLAVLQAKLASSDNPATQP
jgi:Ca-activated chloride channel family protein